MSEKKYHKKDVAKSQLKTAVWLFLNEIDYSSAITLAGASDNILTQLLINEGKVPFLHYACEIHNKIYGFTPKRKGYKHRIEKQMGIISHKHMSPECSDEIEIDLPDSAKKAATRAVLDYANLYGDKEPFIVAFLNWLWVNDDGKAIVEAYNSLPESMKISGFKET